METESISKSGTFPVEPSERETQFLPHVFPAVWLAPLYGDRDHSKSGTLPAETPIPERGPFFQFLPHFFRAVTATS